MLSKILLSVALFQLSISLTMADTCNVFFSTSRSATDGPNSLVSGTCYPISTEVYGSSVYSAWIDGIPSGTGSMYFFSSPACDTNTIVAQGSSPVNFTSTAVVASVFIQSCV